MFKNQLIQSWGRRAMTVARQVTQHGQAHPYSWLVTIDSLSGLEKVMKQTTEVSGNQTTGGMLLGTHIITCQSHFCPVKSLCEALCNYMELSCSTPLFLTLCFSEKNLMLTPRLLQVWPILPPLGHVLSVPPRSFWWHGSVRWFCQVYCFGKSL